MAEEFLVASDTGGKRTRFVLNVFREGDRWTSTLARLDEHGRPVAEAVAPRFYGLTAKQARRRMIDVLESQYESVSTLKEP